jgi:hypothetical protein
MKRIDKIIDKNLGQYNDTEESIEPSKIFFNYVWSKYFFLSAFDFIIDIFEYD